MCSSRCCFFWYALCLFTGATFRLASDIDVATVKEATISALVHEQNLFTGGVSSSAMFRPGKTYIMTAQQVRRPPNWSLNKKMRFKKQKSSGYITAFSQKEIEHLMGVEASL